MKKAKIFGMVHLRALPGTPRHNLSIQEITDLALQEAQVLYDAGLNGIIIENMHDIPYLKRTVGPEIVASCTVVAQTLRAAFPNWSLGLQILAGANKQALAVAAASGLDFIRSEGFVFAHVGDEGILESDAGELLRYRKQIGAEQVQIICDIKKKHAAHSITADINIEAYAHAAQFFLADGVLLTGQATGHAASMAELETLQNIRENLPVWIGSGITQENLKVYVYLADALVVGSHFKADGYWENELSSERIADFMEIFKAL